MFSQPYVSHSVHGGGAGRVSLVPSSVYGVGYPGEG